MIRRTARICLVTDSREPSGVGRHILDLAAELADRYSLVVVAPAAPRSRWFLHEAGKLDVEVWELADGDRAEQAAELADRLVASPADLVHVHAGITWEGHEVALAARAAATERIVRTEHCPYVLTKPVDRKIYDEGITAVDRIVCVSPGVAETFRAVGISEALLSVVRNGIGERPASMAASDVRETLGVEDVTPLAVTVARLTEQKGHSDFIRALPAIARRLPKARFVWIGDGPLEHQIRAELRELRLDHRVKLLLGHADVPALLRAADVVVMPSRFEGLPLVALEAMAAGTPIVGTAVVGLEETVRDGVTGRLVPVDDSRALAAAVIETLSNPLLATKWGRAGRAWQRQAFTAGRMAAETAAVYEEVLGDVEEAATAVAAGARA